MFHTLDGRRALALGSIAMLFGALTAPSAHAQDDRTVVAYGQGQVKPTPSDRNSNAQIAAAVKQAAKAALPRAIADAQLQAQELAAAAGVKLGALQSISNEGQPNGYFGPFGPFGEQGTFGPGRFCGTVTTIRRITGKDGKVRRVRQTRRTCRIPSVVVRQVELTYAIA